MRRRNRGYMKFMDSKHRNRIKTMRNVYLDSISNYRLMKRMHMDTHVAGLMVLDARRKFRDAEEEGFLAKIKSVKDKVNNKITQIIKANPLLSNLAKAWLRITGGINAICGGHNSVQLIKNVIKNLDLFKEGWKRNAPATAGTLVGVAIGGILIPLLRAYLRWKIANEIERRQQDDDFIQDFGVKGMKKGVKRFIGNTANLVRGAARHAPNKAAKAFLLATGSPYLLANRIVNGPKKVK